MKKVLIGISGIVIIIFIISLTPTQQRTPNNLQPIKANNVEPVQQQKIPVPEKPKRTGILKHDADSLVGETSRVLCDEALQASAGTMYAIQRGAKIEILEENPPGWSDAVRIRIIEGVGVNVSLPEGAFRPNTNKNGILCWTTTGVILESDDPTVQRTDIERHDF